jgi:hypothetical protein
MIDRRESMTTNIEELDNLNNSLTEELGIETFTLLPDEIDGHEFPGIEALVTYAAYLFGIFVWAFLKTLNKELKKEANAAGKKLAHELIKQIENVLPKLKRPEQASKSDRRLVLSTADKALKEAIDFPEVADKLQGAIHAGQAEIAAKLKAKNMQDADVKKKTERLTKIIVSRIRVKPL